MEIATFQLSLVHTSSGVFQIDHPPDLVLAAQGMIVPEELRPRVRDVTGGDACGAMLWTARLETDELMTRSVPLSRADVQLVIERLDALGVPAREPRLDGVVDTSDSSTTTHLAGGRSDPAGRMAPFHVFLSQMASGYRGPSAGAFSSLCRTLLELAGVPHGPPGRQWDTAIWDELVFRAR